MCLRKDKSSRLTVDSLLKEGSSEEGQNGSLNDVRNQGADMQVLHLDEQWR